MAAPFPVSVEVQTRFVAEQSDLATDQYVFAYRITISNAASVPVQLIARHWIITDMNGGIQEVRGEGVVGEQPRLEPGQSFEYTSGVTLGTPVGTMRGSYQMVTQAGEAFDVPIAEFLLSIPRTLH